jgi:phosphatidylserine/phosphatidylglycerophosphate/cardiolipin synthase-like enzyme
MKKKKSEPTADPIVVTNADYGPLLLQLLDHAREHIDIIAYSFAIGSAAGTLNRSSAPYEVAQKLADLKTKRGPRLRIRLYIESRRETSDRNQVTASFLKKAGVQIRYGSTHAKGFRIDNRYVLFGSTNLTHQSMVKNNEANLLFDDAEVAVGFGEYFEHYWGGGKHGGIKLSPPLVADGGFKDRLIQVISSAKKRIEFSIYFFHHSEIENALIDAHNRGVKVRGLIHTHSSFALSYVRRTRGTASRLLEAGIKELRFGPPDLFTHSKFVISDRKEVVLGTGNWLHEDVKVHPQLYVFLQNPSVAKALAKYLTTRMALGSERKISKRPPAIDRS